MNENGEKEMDVISVSQALQIAGRAGRFGTQFDKVIIPLEPLKVVITNLAKLKHILLVI